jgi:hypothetical protein
MPYKVKKNDGAYSVTSPRGTKAKNTTKKKAESQVRLLQAVEHNPDFKPRGGKKMRQTKHYSCGMGEYMEKRMGM